MNLLIKTCIGLIALLAGTEVFAETHQTFVFQKFTAVAIAHADKAIFAREQRFCEDRYNTFTVRINKDPSTVDVAQFASKKTYIPLTKHADQSESVMNDFISEVSHLKNLNINGANAILTLQGGAGFNCESHTSVMS